MCCMDEMSQQGKDVGAMLHCCRDANDEQGWWFRWETGCLIKGREDLVVWLKNEGGKGRFIRVSENLAKK